MLFAILLVLLAILWRLSRPVQPDPRMVALAVRATVYALPAATPQQVLVTQFVVVTATPTATLAPTATLTPTAAATPIPEPAAKLASPEPAPVEAPAVAAPSASEAEPVPAADVRVVAAEASLPCPTTSENQYALIPVAGGGLAHPAEVHADLNLSVRGYEPVAAESALFDKDGPVDADPPQLAGLLGGAAPHFGQGYQVHDWNWSCAEHGCRGALLERPAVALVELANSPGASISIPQRGAQIYGGGYKAMVLYAETTRIVLGFTRDDSVANGYVVHVENVCVDPNLLESYARSAAAGRALLPALREGETVGVANIGSIRVAVRDRGAFLDPRSRLDWWQGQ